jgi:phage protein U
MIIPTIPDAVKEIALSRLLALTPFVGYIGDFDGEFSGSTIVADVGRAMEGSAIIFVASDMFVQTYQNMTRKASARWIDHEVIGGRQVSEFMGPNLREIEFEILLHSTMCFDPLSAYNRLEKACESGHPQLMFLNGKNYKYWTIRSVSSEDSKWTFTRPAVMVVNLVMREYISSTPTEAELKEREDELKRGDTGKGGPDRLPGKGGKRELTAKTGLY